MKVLALVSDAFGGHGGIALYNRNVLTAVCEHPRTTHVVAIPRNVPHQLQQLPDELEFRAAARGSKVHFVVEAVRQALRPGRLDLIMVSHLHLLPVAQLVRRLSGAPIMLFVYGVEAWTAPRGLVRGFVESVHTCVSIRQYTLDRMSQWAKLDNVEKVVLENAIELQRFGRSVRRADLVERFGLAGKRVLVTLGRLDNRNFGADEIIEVMPDLLTEVPNLIFLVFGSGPHAARLRAKAERWGVGREVILAGPVSDEEKADHYRLADAFAMPGSNPIEYDRYPLRFVFLEAMACGLPVVASRPEELADLAQSPLPNIYVDPTDPEDLKRGLLEALARGAGEVPEELERYSYPSFRERLHGIVDKVLGL